jgi:hypothetical protein
MSTFFFIIFFGFIPIIMINLYINTLKIQWMSRKIGILERDIGAFQERIEQNKKREKTIKSHKSL